MQSERLLLQQVLHGGDLICEGVIRLQPTPEAKKGDEKEAAAAEKDAAAEKKVTGAAEAAEAAPPAKEAAPGAIPTIPVRPLCIHGQHVLWLLHRAWNSTRQRHATTLALKGLITLLCPGVIHRTARKLALPIRNNSMLRRRQCTREAC